MRRHGGSFPWGIGVAAILGVILGVLLGERASSLGELATLLIRCLKGLATPLVFFTVIDTFSQFEIQLKNTLRLLSLSLLNAAVAGMIALSVFSLAPVEPNEHLIFLGQKLGSESAARVSTANPPGVVSILSSSIPTSVLDPFIQNNVIAATILAMGIGIFLRKLKRDAQMQKEADTLIRFFSGGARVMSELLGWVVKLIPFAVFGVLAKVVGLGGFKFIPALSLFVLIVMGAIFVHSFIYYPLFIRVLGQAHFFRDAAGPISNAFGAGSSLATLPITLQTLREKMKVSEESARLAACVGTQFNHNGILLYEAVAALFVAKAHGIVLGVGQKIILLGASVLAAVGIAGVPEAGLITLSLVLSALNLPLTLIPLLMTVDWFMGRLRAASNVLGDMVVAVALDRWDEWSDGNPRRKQKSRGN